MRIVMFYQSLISDWNHGNAHFLRGISTELIERGHSVKVFEPENGWSLSNLVARYGEEPVRKFKERFPQLQAHFFHPDSIDLDSTLWSADLVIAHEWNEPGFIRELGAHRRRTGTYRLLFHDTHHRSLTEGDNFGRLALEQYDGVLAYGRVIRDRYLSKGWAERVWVWHEAADTRVFRPIPGEARENDVVWVGNWGDEERTRELNEFLVEPVGSLGLKGKAFGVRYPESGISSLKRAGIDYSGWLPNYEVPEIFAKSGATVHIPRRPYVELLPGIPTIRPFEALACGIPLVCSPWEDAEGLFSPGKDFLVARNGEEMRRHLKSLLNDRELSKELASHGMRTVLAKHTCKHRVDELLRIGGEIGLNGSR